MIELELLTENPLYQLKDACCVTMGKRAYENSNGNEYCNAYNGDKESYDKVYDYFVKQFVAKHSVLRVITFKVTDTAIRADVMGQILRATKGHPQPFCQSHRPDWNDGEPRKPSNETFSLFQTIWTPESFMAMCRQRLCFRAMKETRDWTIEVLKIMRSSREPFFNALAACCVPECIYQGGCPELKSCHWVENHQSVINCNISERYKKYSETIK